MAERPSAATSCYQCNAALGDRRVTIVESDTPERRRVAVAAGVVVVLVGVRPRGLIRFVRCGRDER
jgi:hypothetical protein